MPAITTYPLWMDRVTSSVSSLNPISSLRFIALISKKQHFLPEISPAFLNRFERRYKKPGETGDACQGRKDGSQQQRIRRSSLARHCQAKSNQCRAYRLSGQARCRHDAAGASASMRRRTTHDGFQIRRLKEAEADSANRHAYPDAERGS